MEPSKDAIAVRVTRLNRQITGKVTSGTNRLSRKIDRETLLDALTVLYNECNEDPIKKADDLVQIFVDKYRSALAELRSARVCISDFDILQTIGRGHFGEVHMVREKQTGDVYALKSVRKEQARKRVSGAADERDILASSSGQWMPRLQYAFQDNSNLYLVMELCSGGDLASFISRCSHPLSEKDAAFYVVEVAHALKALHGMGFVHRDIKPANILIDRCGHIKLGDFGSCARLSEGGCVLGGTADYVAPELLAAADCASHTHTVCLQYCHITTALSACDYWSLGVVAFELVTLKRPFSTCDEDSVAQVLSNIQRYEQDSNREPPFDPLPSAPSMTWRGLVAGLLRVQPARRFNYLDTLRHPALAHIALHAAAIRDQAPPWVPSIRGAEDSRYLSSPPRQAPPPCIAPFRTRPPFAGHLPFVGYSYVAPEDNEETLSSYTSSHDSTAIDLATFKSAEKLAAIRAKEIASLQTKLASAECAVGVAAERARRDAEDEAERVRARLQADITALSLQNKRLERQLEVEKEERMALERTNQELSSGIKERSNAEIRAVKAQASELQSERDLLKEDMSRLEARVQELQSECASAVAAADTVRSQHKHYKDTVAKERALRRQTISGSDVDSARLAAAEASAAREQRARMAVEERLAATGSDLADLRGELEHLRECLCHAQSSAREKDRLATATSQELNDMQTQLAQEKMKASSLQAQLQELERGIAAAAQREAVLEEQSTRTEARLQQRLEAAEARASAALQDDARHREKVTTLEQLVRQLEREVSAMESRACVKCISHAANVSSANANENVNDNENVNANAATNTSDCDLRLDARSDTESVVDSHVNVQVTLLREQLERAETQLQARADEIATLRQEARSANLARWRKEKEYNDLSLDAKVTARDFKRAEERIATLSQSRKVAEEKSSKLERELAVLKPQYEQTKKDMERYKDQLDKLQKTYDVLQAEVDRSRNDIRKLRSEVQYSEKRRLHAEEQEEMSARERAQLRDELAPLRAQNNELIMNNKALQEACGLLEEQLTDLEKLADLHELKNKDLESEMQRMRSELETCRTRVAEAERQNAEKALTISLASQREDEAREQLEQARSQINFLKERLENREVLMSELESRAAELESACAAHEAALTSAARRLRDLQEESAALRTRALSDHARALAAQAGLDDAQEEASAAREAHEAAAAWWRTRETKADATIRQQAKLIDFLQAKVEEAGRKKCSLSNKLFGRSGRRTAASPPLLRVNRELREEVERLRAKLSAANISANFPPTPRRERPESKPKKIADVSMSLDNMSDSAPDKDSLLVIWNDGTRERMAARFEEGALTLSDAHRRMRARLHADRAADLPHNEANRAFAVRVEHAISGRDTATLVCSSIAERNEWVSRLTSPAARAGYAPAALAAAARAPACALYVAPNVIAIGCAEGLRSLRGPVRLEWEGAVSSGGGGVSALAAGGAGMSALAVSGAGVTALAAGGGRALAVSGAGVAHAGLLALGSALRRASSLRPAVPVRRVHLTEHATPHLIQAISSETEHGVCAAIACGRRVFLLRFEASDVDFKIVRSLTVDRPPDSILLTPRAVYIAGEKPLKVNLPSGALETFAMDDITVAAAAKKHLPPKAILLIKEKPVEILLCYAECGVFVDENGKRTRNEEPKWSAAVHRWEFVSPFLYAVGEDRVSIIHLNEEAYRAPPCTCDSASIASSASSCYALEIFNYKVEEPTLLGRAPNGIIISSKTDSGYQVSIVEGMAAFKSIGASLESLATISKGSTTDLTESLTDLSPQNDSQESVELTTGFLADIRNRAKQLRNKNREEMQSIQASDDIIKEILTTEVGLRRPSQGRRSPVISEFDSDTESESEGGTGSTKCTADVCADMFTRQVRQPNI